MLRFILVSCSDPARSSESAIKGEERTKEGGGTEGPTDQPTDRPASNLDPSSTGIDQRGQLTFCSIRGRALEGRGAGEASDFIRQYVQYFKRHLSQR